METRSVLSVSGFDGKVGAHPSFVSCNIKKEGERKKTLH
jgi:hypothetical protein